jgi:hypothetical protein
MQNKEKVLAILKKIELFIEDAIENGENEKVSEIIEAMDGIVNDYWMFKK